MNKHQVNRSRAPGGTGTRKSKIPQMSALGLAIAAAMAVSGAPGLGVSPEQPVGQSAGGPGYQAVAYVEPVKVSLLSGVDAINWEAPGVTSTAADPGEEIQGAENAGALQRQGADPGLPGSQSNGAGILVGQGVGVLGALPGNLQLMHPVSSRHITSPYGWRNNPTGAGTQIHIGQDYAIGCGSPVYASAAGVVIQSAWAGHSGMRVTIDHGSSVRTGYSHNSKLIAKMGDTVRQGQVIALSGTTGNSTGCHVHFEVIINGRWNDPRNFLPPIAGQPNPMVDSRQTTIAAGPIRNPGNPRTPLAGAHDLPELLGSAPRSPDAAPVLRPGPVAAPKPEPKPEPKLSRQTEDNTQPEKTPKPKPQTTPKPQAKPSPSPKPKPPTAPSPTKEAPSKVPPSAAPETTVPAPTEEAPSKVPPSAAPETTAPPPTEEAPTTDVPKPDLSPPPVNDVPLLEMPLPESDAQESPGAPSEPPTIPKAKPEPPVAKPDPRPEAAPGTPEPTVQRPPEELADGEEALSPEKPKETGEGDEPSADAKADIAGDTATDK